MGQILVYQIWNRETHERICRINCNTMERVSDRILKVNGQPFSFSYPVAISVSTLDEGIWHKEMKGETIESNAGGTQERTGEETRNNQDARGNTKAEEKNKRTARKKVV
jgi:hypothetical protein